MDFASTGREGLSETLQESLVKRMKNRKDPRREKEQEAAPPRVDRTL